MATRTTSSKNTGIAGGTRAEALRFASQAALPRVPESAAFAWTKSLYAAIMPVRKRHGARPTTPLAERVAALASVDVEVVAGLNAIPLNQPLDPRGAEVVARAAGPLALVVRSIASAAEAVRAEAYRTQDALAGRACTSEERDNFRTRVASALISDAVDVLTGEPALLSDETGLAAALRDAALAAMAVPADGRWGTSWTAARRRENGAAPDVTTMTASELTVWRAHSLAVRPDLVRFAGRLTRGDHGTAEDLVQDTLEKMFCQGSIAERAAFRTRAFDYLRKANSDRVAREITRDRTEQSVDWTERSGEGTGRSYEERTFGAASREWSGAIEVHDGELDSRSELDALLSDLGTHERSATQRALEQELARLALNARRDAQQIDELTERGALVRHLTRTALTAGAASEAAARRAVTALLAELADRR